MEDGRSNGSEHPPTRHERRNLRVRLILGLGVLGAVSAGAGVVLAVPPGASFTAPAVLQIGQGGTFTSTTPDPDADGDSITATEWDFTNDGTIDASGTSVTHSYATAGQKTVRMRVTDSAGETAETTHAVRVNAPPSATFTATPNPAAPNQVISFDASGTTDADGTIADFAWDFDNDGTFDASGTGATHAYATPGARTVVLRVRDDDGATSVVARTVTVNSPPTARLSASPTTATIGQTINLSGAASSDPDGTIVRYEWDRDGNGSFETDTGATATTTTSFGSGGTKTLRLRVTDNAGATAVDTETVTINAPPTASFTALGGAPTPAVPDVGETVTFNGGASSDPDGSIARYEWDLDGNGSFETDTGASATTTRSFPTRGSKTVGLRVTDDSGATGSATVTFRVNARPVAKIAFAAINAEPGQNPQVPIIGQQVGFVSTSTDEESTNPPQSNNSITSFSWLDANLPGTGPAGPFGGSQSVVVHDPYTTAGDKRVVLQVTDNDQATSADPAIATVRVNTRPTATFTFSPQTPVTNELITFDADADDPDPDNLANPSNGVVTRYEWDLDDDGTYGETAPGLDEVGAEGSARFATQGVKAVHLRVYDGGGARSLPVDRTVEVMTSRPRGAFTSTPADPVPGTPVTFTSTSQPSSAGLEITSTEWDFDYDRQTFTPDASGPSASHAFATPGVKTIAVRVTETGGGTDIAEGTVRVNAPPQASFRAAPSNPVAGEPVTFSSTSADPDGPITQEWDTDGDGAFDDATGAVATRTFAQPGNYKVALRVTDDRGARAVAVGDVHIAPRPPALTRLLGASVSIAGHTTRGGAVITLLRVRAPVGAKAIVRCRGGTRRGCPAKGRQEAVLKRDQARFKRFERALRRGARLTVAVTMDGFIGRHVRFAVRAGKQPKRTDRCLAAGAAKRTACQGSA